MTHAPRGRDSAVRDSREHRGLLLTHLHLFHHPPAARCVQLHQHRAGADGHGRHPAPETERPRVAQRPGRRGVRLLGCLPAPHASRYGRRVRREHHAEPLEDGVSPGVGRVHPLHRRETLDGGAVVIVGVVVGDADVAVLAPEDEAAVVVDGGRRALAGRESEWEEPAVAVLKATHALVVPEVNARLTLLGHAQQHPVPPRVSGQRDGVQLPV